MPIFDKRTQMVVENDRDHGLEIGYLKISPGRQLPTIPEELNKVVTRTAGRIIVQSSLISSEFTHNTAINQLFQIRNDTP